MSDIKSCPFCGVTPHQDDLEPDEAQGNKWGSVICPCCGCKGPEVRTQYQSIDGWREDAFNEWNKRR